LRELSAARLRQVVDNVTEGILVAQDGRFRYANPAALALTGYTMAEIDGAEFLPMVHPEDRQQVIDHHLRRLRGEEVEPRYDFRVLTRAGEAKWIQLSAVMIDWDGAPATLSFISDISDRKRAEEALRASESRYRSVIEGAPIGIVIVQDNRLKYVNPEFARMVGNSPADLLGRASILERVHPEDRERMTALAREAVSRPTGDTLRVVYRILRDDGSTLSMDVSSVQVEWEGRRATLGFVQDVGERLRLEQDLKRSLAERELILENSVVGIAFLTPEGRVKWANRAMGQIFGASLQERYGQSLESNYASRESYLATGAAVAEAVIAGRAYEAELQMRRNDGTLFWVQLSGKAINTTDLSQGTVWVVRDIDRRKRLEVELRRSNAEREAILQSTLVGISHSIDRRHQWVNRRFASMIGWEPEALIGQSPAVHFRDDADWQRFLAASDPALRAGRPFSAEWELRRRDGTTLWTELHGAPVEPGDLAKGTIWTVVDISARRQAEADIRAALEQQRELNQLKSRFVSMTSHEFRTPLASILSSSQLLRRYGERLPEAERGELYDTIEAAVKRMTTMLEDILFIGRADSERLRFRPAPLELAPFCEQLLAEARTAAAAASAPHELVLELAEPQASAVLDEDLLRHILENLIANAVKYSPGGGRITLAAQADDGSARFTVSDEGIGMSKEELPRLFEAFYRASNTAGISGTGLGLAIVKQCVDVHGGTISIDTELGRGTRFTVTLPCGRAGAAARPQARRG